MTDRRLQVAAMGGLAIVAVAVGVELLRPFASGAAGFDSAASVIHFERIAGGRHLEAFVTATPKPFLTVVYGLLMAAGNDWRLVSLAAIAAFAGCVVLGACLAGRLGGTVAAVFAAAALLASRSLLADVAIAYAVPWALLLWLVAGLALTGHRRRPLLAGIALAGATLARLETAVVVGAIAVGLPIAWWLARRAGRSLERRWWLLLTAAFALPVMLLHDLLLTGDPLFWMSVSGRYSAAAPDAVLTPIELLRAAWTRYVPMALLVGLGLLGLARLAIDRVWPVLIGLAALTGGIGAFLLVLAARGTYVSNRYFFAIDVALVIAAAIGFGWLLEAGIRRLKGRDPRLVGPAAVAVAALTASLAIWPVASLSVSFREAVQEQRLQAEHADRARPVLDCVVAQLPGARTFPDPATALAATLPDDVVVLVPAFARPRLAHDLGLPLYAIGGLAAGIADPAGDFLPHGRVVLHDRLGDQPEGAFAALEVHAETTVGDTTLTPLIADPDAGLWVVVVTRPGEAAVGAAGCRESRG